MIKQIQLRGISHRPSDRMTADGGLEECIDLRLEEQEQTVAKAPVDVTDELAPGLSASGIDVMYIHKGGDYTNYIGTKVYTEDNTDVTYLVAYVNTSGSTWSVVQIRALSANPVAFASIGNFVIVNLSDDTTLYALFRRPEYKAYSSVSRPKVTFSTTELTPPEIRIYSNATGLPGATTSSTAKGFWDVTREYGSEDEEAFLDNLRQYLWAQVDKEKKEQRETNKAFTAPLLARYAVKLYDGSYIHVSEPVLLFGANENSAISEVRANLGYVNTQSQGTQYRFVSELKMNHCFTVQANMVLEDAGDWSDIVSSVDVFLSTDILIPKHGTALGDATEDSERTITDPTLTFNGNDILISFEGGMLDKEAFEEEYLKKDNFYKVASFPIEDFPVSAEIIAPVAQDELVVKQRLPEGQEHSVSPHGKTLTAYNMRLVTGEQSVRLSPGHAEPQALADSSYTPTSPKYSIEYFVKDEYGADHVFRGFLNRQCMTGAVRAYVSYPDPRCYKAALYVDSGTTTIYYLPMKEHPRLNCSYGFWGLDSQLDSSGSDDRTSVSFQSSVTPPVGNPVYTALCRLALSEFENPFVFPLGQRQRFSDRIIGVVPATIALSTGQFGQFPLYVFTEGGIWTISLDDEGKMAASHPVSRDVAVDGTIAQLDQAIVFVSNQGVMILQGSQISCLSTFMDGPQYTIKDIAPAGSALRTSLTADGYGSLLGLSLDTTAFKDFVNGCKPLYDYENKRILLFNPNKSFIYECELESQTWRKHTLPDTFVRNLNGYPSAFSYLNGKIYDWSVVHNYNEVNPSARKGWVLTRPFDLGAPDIRKSINSIRIRGVFNKTDVKYILLGSMNGIDWQRLTSLRGGSYKSFRLLILTDLAPGEKLSWIDIDFETRFGNKLR